MSKPVVVVGEWLRTGPFDQRQVWHLAKGRGDADWQDVWCGGGIVYPAPRERVSPDLVCPECKAERRRSRGS
jgi:hypothetical protein